MLRSDDFLLQEMVLKGLTSLEDVERAQAEHPESDVAAELVRQGVVTERDVSLVRAVVCETPYVDLSRYDITIANAQLLPRAIAEAHSAFPLFVFDGGAVIGMADPLDFRGLDQIRQRMNTDVEAVLCEPTALEDLISRAYRRTAAVEAESAADTGVSAVDLEDPVVATVEEIISGAIIEGASDIHLGPDDGVTHLRYRIDGVLQQRQPPTRAMHDAIVRRLKVMAKLDLTQTRKPLDGKITFAKGGETFDLRLSVIPTIWGENVVIRVLRRAVEIQGFAELGLPGPIADSMDDLLSRPHGMILVTGPTGSGKTTTLYTALSKLNSPERNIMTVEDPVEVRLPMVRQSQVNTDAGLTFATALRSILRQDPDVVLVGEIRDEETAQIAVQAALTGHLVLSTLHTNDAAGAIARLADFHIPPFAMSSSLLGVLAQRLIRKSCSVCREPAVVERAELDLFQIDPADASALTENTGCPACGGTGYRGRCGVYEFLRVTPRVRGLIARGASPIELAAGAAEEGMVPLWKDGVAKALKGETTLAEIARVRADEPAQMGAAA